MESTLFTSLFNLFFAKEQVHRHWYTPVDNFQYLSSEFYEAIEKQLTLRKVPGLEISRINLSEGGLLSDNREYLRLKRERLVFDICAAPFGTSFFFSFRFVELPLRIKPLELVILLAALCTALWISVKLFGLLFGPFTFLLCFLAGMYFLRNLLGFGLKDIDSLVLGTPVIGPIYEIAFRPETYYREDTRLMYLTTVNSITEALVAEITLAKGIKLVNRHERNASETYLYKERTINQDLKGDTDGVRTPHVSY